MRTINFIILLFLVLLIFISGCKKETAEEKMDQKQVELIAKNILESFDNGDYINFSRDFSAEMRKAITEKRFNDLKSLISKTSGRYISIEGYSPNHTAGFIVYLFTCRFEKEEVKVQITFRPEEYEVKGLYFDSENIRKSMEKN